MAGDAHRHPQTQAEYRFACRNATAYPLADLVDEVNAELDHLCSLRFTPDELAYMASLRYIKSDFIDFLRLFQFQRNFIRVQATPEGGLRIEAHGPQVHVMGFEIHVLAIVNELYFRRLAQPGTLEEGRRRLQAKITAAACLRTNPPWPIRLSCLTLACAAVFRSPGTAKVSITTLTREVPQRFKVHLQRAAGQGVGHRAHWHHGTRVFAKLSGIGRAPARLSESRAGRLGAGIPRRLGIALTDTVGMHAFLQDFDLSILPSCLTACATTPATRLTGATRRGALPQAAHQPAHQAAGVSRRAEHRQSAGAVALLCAAHSAGLWHWHQPDQRRGPEPLNIVMKLVRANGQPVAKISDTPGKTLCDDETYLAYLRQVFGIADSDCLTCNHASKKKHSCLRLVQRQLQTQKHIEIL